MSALMELLAMRDWPEMAGARARRLMGAVRARLGSLALRFQDHGSRLHARRVPLAAALLVLLVLSAVTPVTLAAVSMGMLVIVAASALLAAEGHGNGLGSGDRRAAGERGRPELWTAIVEAIPDPAVVLDQSGFVLRHNARAVELFPKLRAGIPISSANRAPELIDAVDRAVDSAGPQIVQLIERVPVERRVQATVTRLAIAAEGGEPALLITFRDHSQQDRLDRMRQDFVANASHELRTPLASLRGFVETLQGSARNDTKARERFLEIMASQATRMSRLIDDLLSLSRIEMSEHLAPGSIVDLNDVAGYVAQTMEPVAAAAKAKLLVEPLDGTARVRGDRDEMVQVVSNLMQNAIKYGRVGGSVRVRVRREPNGRSGARLALSVTDDGPGIAPHHLPRLTERFYRVNVASSREKGGTGLGLAIVKHVVNRHRGELRIASKVGEGSTFTVLLDEFPNSVSSRK